jgi:hypothetical protein
VADSGQSEEHSPEEGEKPPLLPGRDLLVGAYRKHWPTLRQGAELFELGAVLKKHDALAWAARAVVVMGDMVWASLL